MTLLLEELFTCPNCKVVFQAKVAASYDTFGNHYSDLYFASGKDPQPILYLIHICPKCGFAAYTIYFKSFEISLDLVKDAINKIEAILQKKPSQFNPGDGYLEIAEYISNYISKEQKVFSQLHACYAYRELQDNNLKLARELTLKTIKEVLLESKFQAENEEYYLYLAGELNRLLGKNRESLEYFELASKIVKKGTLVYKLVTHQLVNPSNILPKEIFR
ncbi:MAG: DUF2225 domain-containing protein [Candidatus Thorarchaeota archaeon]